MKIFSDCSGPCETCKIHYLCACLAGHGDDDYEYADPEWIECQKAKNQVPYWKREPKYKTLASDENGNILVVQIESQQKRDDKFIDVELLDRTISILKRWLRVAPKPSFLNADTADLLRDLETVKQLETK